MDNFSKFINNDINEAKTPSLPPKLHFVKNGVG